MVVFNDCRKTKNKVIITVSQCQETYHMEPGELKVKKKQANYLKGRKTRVKKFCFSIFLFRKWRNSYGPSTKKRKSKLHLVTLDKKLKTAQTILIVLFTCSVKVFFLITYLFLLAERAVFKFYLKMISNGKLKQPTCRS